MRRRVLPRRGHAHQPGQHRAEPFAAGGDEAVGLAPRNAGFLRLVADVHLDEKKRRPSLPRHRLRERLGEPRPVEALDRVGEPHREPRLVRLQAADQVQPELGVSGAESGEFLRRLLHPVLAEMDLAGRECREHRRLLLGLRDRNQCDVLRPAARGERGGADAHAHQGEVRSDARLGGRLRHRAFIASIATRASIRPFNLSSRANFKG